MVTAHSCIACSTGQRLHCPDDSTCPYTSFDKSALLRHRQRKHGYRAKLTASKDRCKMNVSKDRMSCSEKPDDPSGDDSTPSSPSEHVTDPCCSCCSPTLSESSGEAPCATDETDIWQGDNHASPQQAITGITRQAVESIEWSLVEGHVTSRFPVSSVRTCLPNGLENGALPALKHYRCCTSVQLAVHSGVSGPFR
jgi:hypothetical protein